MGILKLSILLPFDFRVTNVFQELETGRWVHGQKAKQRSYRQDK